MDYFTADGTVLTDAELFCLRRIAGSREGANWYQLERFLHPDEYPDQDINSVHILTRLEQAGLIEQLPKTTNLEKYIATAEGVRRLQIK